MIDPNIWNHLMLTKDKKTGMTAGRQGFCSEMAPPSCFLVFEAYRTKS